MNICNKNKALRETYLETIALLSKLSTKETSKLKLIVHEMDFNDALKYIKLCDFDTKFLLEFYTRHQSNYEHAFLIARLCTARGLFLTEAFNRPIDQHSKWMRGIYCLSEFSRKDSLELFVGEDYLIDAINCFDMYFDRISFPRLYAGLLHRELILLRNFYRVFQISDIEYQSIHLGTLTNQWIALINSCRELCFRFPNIDRKSSAILRTKAERMDALRINMSKTEIEFYEKSAVCWPPLVLKYPRHVEVQVQHQVSVTDRFISAKIQGVICKGTKNFTTVRLLVYSSDQELSLYSDLLPDHFIIDELIQDSYFCVNFCRLVSHKKCSVFVHLIDEDRVVWATGPFISIVQ